MDRRTLPRLMSPRTPGAANTATIRRRAPAMVRASTPTARTARPAALEKTRTSRTRDSQAKASERRRSPTSLTRTIRRSRPGDDHAVAGVERAPDRRRAEVHVRVAVVDLVVAHATRGDHVAERGRLRADREIAGVGI